MTKENQFWCLSSLQLIHLKILTCSFEILFSYILGCPHVVLIFDISVIDLLNKECLECLLSTTAGLLIMFGPKHWQTGSFSVLCRQIWIECSVSSWDIWCLVELPKAVQVGLCMNVRVYLDGFFGTFWVWWKGPINVQVQKGHYVWMLNLNQGKVMWWSGLTHKFMFKCRKVITLECWNWTKDKVMWCRGLTHKYFLVQKDNHALILKLNPRYMVRWRGPMHKYLSAERSSYLNVEIEPKIKWCGGGDPCINV